MYNSWIIRGGLVIDTEPQPAMLGKVDVLVREGRIAAIGPALSADGVEEIDATGMIVLPGFVDSHRHTWQATLRAVAPDTTLGHYAAYVLGELAPRLSAEDVHTGIAAGVRECLDGGITTMLDWSHVQFTPEHTDAAIDALTASGVRAVFGFCYGGADQSLMAPEGRRVQERLTGDLLTIAIAAFGPEFDGPDRAAAEWRLARELDVPVSVHMGGLGAESAANGLAFLDEHGFMSHRIAYIHANHYTDEHLKRIADSGGSVSVSPFSEMALAIGYPITGRARALGIPASLSADAVTSGPGDMFGMMRAAHALERGRPEGAGLGFTTRDALRMATIEGAEVVGLADVTGSLRIGKQADLQLLRTDTPSMAGSQDMIGAVVLSADTSTVDTVLVAGRVLKRAGQLVTT
ncbi:amidohydrolase family protein [Nonomuraea africana]|uniref:Cytosine/adenosine deaminase-related metal-dependent hydrolase n=1 Tax=Nonomuraea africana TaxID=46171 RepID=A0ABR9K635_9ACTN|nr:amidohydrolase family protein [Nonomuraea africana]MBE1557476.1 cytosine/adenosine deaminase-related metal-dependent hydrolase [Nonomuraea africana]